MRFEPSYMVIGKGDTVSFPNGDAVTHNVFSVSRANRFDLGLYNPGANKHVKFPTAGVVDVFCNIHENMHATVVVVPSSHFATVTETGGFVFSGVRPGRHNLVVWRRGKEVAREAVVVSAGKSSRIKIRKGD